MVELWSLVSIYTFLFFGEVLIKINGLSLRILRYCVDIFHTLYGSVYLLIKL